MQVAWDEPNNYNIDERLYCAYYDSNDFRAPYITSFDINIKTEHC